MLTLLISIAAAFLGSPGQESAPVPGRLTLDVAAVGTNGLPVTDLRPAEFELWISGFRVPVDEVAYVTPEQAGRTVIVLLDNGAVGPTMTPRIKEAARLFVKQMGDDDRMAIAPLYGGTVELTSDRTRLLQAVDAYHVQGFPFRLEDAGEHVLRVLTTISRRLPETLSGRKVIVAIGAGWLLDNPLPPPGVRDLRAEWVNTMRAMAAAGTSVYVIDPAGVGAGPFRTYGGSSGFARETGGYAFLNTNDVKGAVTRILAEAGTYYVLRFADPPVQRGAELRDVDVRVLRKGVTVRARRGLPGGEIRR